MSPSVFVHVGFANTGTTSLQHNFFSRRGDIYYVGVPYTECNELFSTIKHCEDFNIDLQQLTRICDDVIYKASGGRSIVISDETFTDTHQRYFAPYLMPRDIIATRLKHLFPSAKIVFTIRDQRHYAASMYLNLKRNSAFLDRILVPQFSHWLNAYLDMLRPTYLDNLNFMETIALYARLFKSENILLLPLEVSAREGPERYLGTLCSFMQLNLQGDDLNAWKVIQNRRMSSREEVVSELFQDCRFRKLYTELEEAIGRERLSSVLKEAPPSSVSLSSADEGRVRSRVGLGNRLIAAEFGIDLASYGYLFDEGQKFYYPLGVPRMPLFRPISR